MGNAVDVLYHRRVEARRKQAEKERKVFQACLVWAHSQEERLKREAADRRQRRQKERENERLERDRIFMEICLKNIDKEKRKEQMLLKEREENRIKRMREVTDLSERRMKEKEEHIKRENEITRKNIEHIEKLYSKSRENTKTRIHLIAKKHEEERKDFIRRASTAEKTYRNDMERSKKRIKNLEKKIVTERMLWHEKLLTARRINGEKKKTSQELWTIGRDIVEKRKLVYDKTHDEDGNKLSEIDKKHDDSFKQNSKTSKDNHIEENINAINLSTVFEEDSPIIEKEKIQMTPRTKMTSYQKHETLSKIYNTRNNKNLRLQRFYVPQKKALSQQDHHLKFESGTGVPTRQNASKMKNRDISNNKRNVENNRITTKSEEDKKSDKDHSNANVGRPTPDQNRRSHTVHNRNGITERRKDKTSEIADSDFKQNTQNREILNQKRKMAETSPKPDENLTSISIVKYSRRSTFKDTQVNKVTCSESPILRKKQTPGESDQNLSGRKKTETPTESDKKWLKPKIKQTSRESDQILSEAKTIEAQRESDKNRSEPKLKQTSRDTGQNFAEFKKHEGPKESDRKFSEPKNKQISQGREQKGQESKETVSNPKEHQNLTSLPTTSTKSEENEQQIKTERKQTEKVKQPNVTFEKSNELYRKQVVSIMDNKGQTPKQQKGQGKQSLPSITDTSLNHVELSKSTNNNKAHNSDDVRTEVSVHPTVTNDLNRAGNDDISKKTQTLSGSRYDDVAFTFSTLNEVHSAKGSRTEVESAEILDEKKRIEKLISNKKQLGSDKNPKFDEKDPRNGAEANVQSKKTKKSHKPATEDEPSEIPNSTRSAFLNKPSVVQRIEGIGRKKTENKEDPMNSKEKHSKFTLLDSEVGNDVNPEPDSRPIKSIPFKARSEIALGGHVGLFVLDQRISEVQKRIDKMTKSSNEIPVV